MTDNAIPASIDVPMSALSNLAIEWWRLAGQAESLSAPARHAVRRIEDFLKQCQVEAQSMVGRAFDPGLPLRVIDAVDDPRLPSGQAVIEQMLSPIVFWRGQVIKAGDVVTRRGTAR